MSDEADDANHQVALNEERAIRYAQQQAQVPEAEATGFCLFCEEAITEAGRRWCGAFCRGRWEKLRVRG